jgi:hypothetical protein
MLNFMKNYFLCILKKYIPLRPSSEDNSFQTVIDCLTYNLAHRGRPKPTVRKARLITGLF